MSVQVSPELLLAPVEARGAGAGAKVPRPADLEELRHEQYTKRRQFEETLGRNRLNMSTWHKYAMYEVQNRDYARVRLIFERCLQVDPYHVATWLHYADTELRGGFVGHARNVYERVVALLPLEPRPWEAYVRLEESHGDGETTRTAFRRWLEWKPALAVWLRYVAFEVEHGDVHRARAAFERCVQSTLQVVDAYLAWALFEQTHGRKEYVREVYSMGLAAAPESDAAPLLVSWAQYEAASGEVEVAREVLRQGLVRFELRLSNDARALVAEALAAMERRFGGDVLAEGATIQRRILRYQQELAESPRDYDLWWMYLDVVEKHRQPEEVAVEYTRAVATAPSGATKTQEWRDYVKVWLRYAAYAAKHLDADAVRTVYTDCLLRFPRTIVFTKVYSHFAAFEVKQREAGRARKLFGQAIGRSRGRKASVFKRYVAMEEELREFDRVRQVYETWLLHQPDNTAAWVAYGEFEDELAELDRCYALMELALQTVAPLVAGVVWARYVQFYIDDGEYHEARLVARRWAVSAGDSDTWRYYLDLVVETFVESDPPDTAAAREAFEQAAASTDGSVKAGVLALMLAFEQEHGTAETAAACAKRQAVVSRRHADGVESEWYEFPEEAAPATTPTAASTAGAPALSAFMANAKRWAAQQ